jgi:hypothetical protein
MVSLARMGWEPVPASRHPQMMPMGNKYELIERDGQILMERPQEITQDVIRANNRRARDQVRTKEEQLSAAPQGHFERNNKDTPLTKVNKSYEPMKMRED